MIQPLVNDCFHIGIRESVSLIRLQVKEKKNQKQNTQKKLTPKYPL